MTDAPCPNCGGTLLVPTYSGLRAAWNERSRPCQACLSVPADEELRALASEWLGFSPWETYSGPEHDRHHRPGYLDWWVDGEVVVPAWLPAGPGEK